MKNTLRKTLAESHVAAIAVTVLLLWSIDSGFRCLWEPLSRAVSFLFTAVAILDIPYLSSSFTVVDRIQTTTMAFYLLHSLITLAAAWLLSRWVYGMGPLRSLNAYRSRLIRSVHV